MNAKSYIFLIGPVFFSKRIGKNWFGALYFPWNSYSPVPVKPWNLLTVFRWLVDVLWMVNFSRYTRKILNSQAAYKLYRARANNFSIIFQNILTAPPVSPLRSYEKTKKIFKVRTNGAWIRNLKTISPSA